MRIIAANMDTSYMRKETKIKKYYLSPSYPDVYLSCREAQCVAYFLKGYSNRIIGNILNLSSKTIDSYTDNIKKKLNCRSKAELIVKICQTNFMHQSNRLIENNYHLNK